MGDHVRIHSGSVIGADGFGFAPDGTGGYQKIHQIGGVEIGNNVEIGACTTIDRGALENTIIGNGVIIDNHVQIGHNAEVGDNTAMARLCRVSGKRQDWGLIARWRDRPVWWVILTVLRQRGLNCAHYGDQRHY